MISFRNTSFIFFTLLFLLSASVSQAQVDIDFEFNLTGVECFDGVDNDSDGFIDFPNDPDCISSLSDDEGEDYIPPEPEQGDGSGSSTGTVFENNDTENPDEDLNFFERLFERLPILNDDKNFIVDDQDSLFNRNISFKLNILSPNDQDIVSVIPNNDPYANNFRPPVRFILPEVTDDNKELIRFLDDETLVFEGPILVTFFDVAVSVVVDSQQPQLSEQAPFSVILLCFLGIVIATRFTIHEYSKEGVEDEIYHPCFGRLVYSVCSILFLVSIIYTSQTFFASQGISVNPQDIVSLETKLTTNNHIEDHELVVEHEINGNQKIKELVLVSKGFGESKVNIPAELYQKTNVEIQTFVARDAFNTFISRNSLSVQTITPRSKLLIAGGVALLALLLEFFELIFCAYRKRL